MKQIDISKRLVEFKHHLDKQRRVIFSAKFGDGKSTFLKMFQKQYKDDYLCITLHPINYSVAQNEDVFEYIKRDIILELNEVMPYVDNDLDELFEWDKITLADLGGLIDFLESFIPGCKAISGLVKTFNKLAEKNETLAENMVKYDATFRVQRGGIYERNAFTEFINTYIQYVRKKCERKIVLVIEDLDRIDPGHLFRILNVLGAHIDENAATNKFGFDNIVLVMDYDTTRYIFHHYYGQQANYEGYMCKFMSSYVFYYSILEYARELLYERLRTKISSDEVNEMLKAILKQGDVHYSFGELIHNLSVRQIACILDCVDTHLNNVAKLAGGKIIPRDQPIVYLILAVKISGEPYTDIQLRDCLSGYLSLSYWNLLGDFMLTNPNLLGGVFKYYSSVFGIVVQHKSNGFATCSFKQTGNGVVRDFDIREYANNAFEAVSELINSNKYVIQTLHEEASV